jgi:hypothetical protein
LRVRLPPWADHPSRLGRQSADHLGLEPRMLWVRVPPEPIPITSSRSSLECSLPCHGGDRGFKSHRGRLVTARYAIRQSGEAQTFVVCGFDSHPRHSFPGVAPDNGVMSLSEIPRGSRINMAKWCNWQTRDAQNVVPPAGLGVRISPWSLAGEQVLNWLS